MKRKKSDAFRMRSVFFQLPLAIHTSHSLLSKLLAILHPDVFIYKLQAALQTLREAACRKNARPKLSLPPSLSPNGNILWTGQNMGSLTHSSTICTAWFSTFQINCLINFMAKKEKKSWQLARVNGILLSDFAA